MTKAKRRRIEAAARRWEQWERCVWQWSQEHPDLPVMTGRLVNDRMAGRPLTPEEAFTADKLIEALRPTIDAYVAVVRNTTFRHR